jgi:hypothetical protein
VPGDDFLGIDRSVLKAAFRQTAPEIRSLAGVDAEELRHPADLLAGGVAALRSSSGDHV